MKSSALLFVSVIILSAAFTLTGCSGGQPEKPKAPVLATVNGCEIRTDEFEQGFLSSAYANRDDALQARREYLDALVNQKLIILDAQKKNMDKTPDFLNSVERFWAQSLLTVALGRKTIELHKGINVREEDARRIYENMVKDGVTTRPFEEVYPQIKWQAETERESQLLKGWIDGMRKGASVSVNESVLKALK
jgi:hypothetical protein